MAPATEEHLPLCPYTGKLTYPSPQRAWRVARRSNRRQKSRRIQKVHSFAYRCDDGCRLWHTTTRTAREREAKEQ